MMFCVVRVFIIFDVSIIIFTIDHTRAQFFVMFISCSRCSDGSLRLPFWQPLSQMVRCQKVTLFCCLIHLFNLQLTWAQHAVVLWSVLCSEYRRSYVDCRLV